MPVATVRTEAERKDLKSLPEGYVMIRPLPYGMVLKRRDQVTKMSVEGNARGSDSQKMTMEMMQEHARFMEFGYCIVEHNLTDINGTQLDFANRMHFNNLDPKVGQEIEEYIDKLNQPESEDDLETFTELSALSSENQTIESSKEKE